MKKTKRSSPKARRTARKKPVSAKPKKGPSPALAAVSIVILALAVASVFYVFKGTGPNSHSKREILFSSMNERVFYVNGKETATQRIRWNGFTDKVLEVKGEIPDGIYRGYIGGEIKTLITTESYSKGVLNGRYRLYSMGPVIEGLYRDGKKEGVWTVFGVPKSYDTYKKGVLDGRFERNDRFYTIQGWFTDGKIDGVCNQYEKYKIAGLFPGKCLISRVYYKMGVKDGISRYYRPKRFIGIFKTHVIEHVESWKNGKMDGEFRFYDAKGKLSSMSRYKDGEIIENKTY